MAEKCPKFKPSRELVDLIIDGERERFVHGELLFLLELTDEKVLRKRWREALRGRKSYKLRDVFIKKETKRLTIKIVEDGVHSAIVNVAKEAAYKNDHNYVIGEKVSTSGCLVGIFKQRLIDDDGLGLEKSKAEKVLDVLCHELKGYAAIPKKYSWGRMYVADSEICIDVNAGAFKIVDIDDIPRSAWTES